MDYKIITGGDCNLLLLGRKAMANLDSLLKSRDITSLTKVCLFITYLTKVHLIKAVVYLVVMYECENWTIKKAECQRADALKCDVGEDSCESLELRGDKTSQS